jgi:hypothetical protein
VFATLLLSAIEDKIFTSLESYSRLPKPLALEVRKEMKSLEVA